MNTASAQQSTRPEPNITQLASTLADLWQRSPLHATIVYLACRLHGATNAGAALAVSYAVADDHDLAAALVIEELHCGQGRDYLLAQPAWLLYAAHERLARLGTQDEVLTLVWECFEVVVDGEW